jgi:hypothetical protein
MVVVVVVDALEAKAEKRQSTSIGTEPNWLTPFDWRLHVVLVQ